VTTNPLLGGSNLTLTNGTGVLTVNLGTITRSPGGSINIGASSIVNNLVYTAANVGTNGNNIIINYVNGSGNNVATTASVTSNTVTVTLGTNGTGTVNATAAQVAAAINANATVTNLVKVSNVGSGNVVAGSSTLSLGNATVAASNTTVLTPDDVVTTITGTQGFILADPNSTAPYAVITFPVNSNATFNGTTTDFAAIGPGGTIVPYSTIASYYGDTAAQAALVKTGLLAPSVGNNPTDNTDIPLTNHAAVQPTEQCAGQQFEHQRQPGRQWHLGERERGGLHQPRRCADHRWLGQLDGGQSRRRVVNLHLRQLWRRHFEPVYQLKHY
jgi:hypothetical protein